MKISEAFPSKYVAAADLQGQDVPATIQSCVIEDVGGPGESEDRPVLYFTGFTKGLVLNKTNATTIAAMYGDETDEWVGKAVVLFPTDTEFRGKMTPCVRVRSTPPRGPVASASPAATPAPAPEPVPQPAAHAGPSF